MSTETHTPVRPIAPVVGYIGGKRKLAPRILPWIESAPHTCYAEPFAGMLGMFLQRRFRPIAEVVNDRSRDVATFFRVLQRHHTAFLDMLRYQISSRSEFERLRATDADTLTDLERAARFLYLQRMDNSPTVSFATDPTGVREFFKLRDLPNGTRRRRTLKHWVVGHWRKRRQDQSDLIHVRKHLRGAERFTWNGFDCVVRPSPFDLERSYEGASAS